MSLGSYTRKGLHAKTADWTVDMDSEVDEVTAIVKNKQLLIGKLRGYVTVVSSSHNVLRVTLTNSEIYALDITAAQYGWHESAVMPWPTFFEQRVKVINEIRNFGETKRVLKAEAQAAGRARIFCQRIREYMEKGFNNNLSEWQRNNISFKAMPRCSEEEFKIKQDSLLGFMDDRMSTSKVER